jgi:hypothetical protein
MQEGGPMHSQPAAYFKRKCTSILLIGVIPFLCLAISVYLLWTMPGMWAILMAASLGILSLTLFSRVYSLFSKPYLHLTDRQVTVYRGFQVSPVVYSLSDVHSAHTNRPETYIELAGRDSTTIAHIDLHPLDKADRIRFIFLIESNINRKFHGKKE